MERPNAHTRFAYEVVKRECERLGVALPPHHEHAYNSDVLRIEEEEYQLADRLLCPSDFVLRTFLERGFPSHKLARHMYGFDEKSFSAETKTDDNRPFTMLFVGGCAPRKGLHYALEAWLRSSAHETGRFLIAGEFVRDYKERLAVMLSHPSVTVLGHRTDIPELMRVADVLILPTIEEGSALVTSEARGSGCVLVVSDAAGAVVEHMKTGLIHRAGDVNALTDHITALYADRGLLDGLRKASLSTASAITWTAAGERLFRVYADLLAERAAVA
jgi:glycosyltransferase involved in cell wall biosynthesis